jgi:Carboxypeptidase regulatory-like domain
MLLIVTVSPASAQTLAALQGRVVDPSGAALPGASILVRNSATGLTSRTPTDAEGRYRLQLRADAFDLFNHPTFGPPGNVVGSPTFGKISRTRLPTREAGSSRQIQLAAKVSF